MQPLEGLIKLGLAAGRVEMQLLNDDMLKALNPDIVVWQRQSEDYHVETMKRYRAALPNVFMVFEIDDALSQVPERSHHKPFMPPNIDANLALAIEQCDVVTVTTVDLQKHMEKITGGNIPIRIIPNMISKDELQRADAARMQNRKFHKKLRIGWGGGIGHSGDLALIEQAIRELGDEVEWVWAGMHPEMPEGTKSTFLGAVPPKDYLSLLASMDVDLMVAPIEDIPFNHSKSNLRLVEAGACGYPVIASPVAPYLNAPVFGYAATPADWAPRIREFMALSLEERGSQAVRIRNWVERDYILEEHAAKRLKAWLPNKAELFQPEPVPAGFSAVQSRPVVVSRTLTPESVAPYKLVPTLKEALQSKGGSDIIYARPNVVLTVDQIDRLISVRDHDLATISAMSNDGGPCSFPQTGQFTMLDPEASKTLDGFSADRPGTANLTSCAGPVVLLRRAALRAVGWPDEDEILDLSIIEWASSAAARGFRNVVNFSVYVGCPAPTTFTQETANRVAMRMGMRWPQVETEMAKINDARNFLELRFHRESYRYLPPQDQGNYETWQSILDTQGPRTSAIMEDWIRGREVNLVLVPYGEDFDLPLVGDWLLFFRKNALLSERAIPMFFDAIDNVDDRVKIIYADHDYLNQMNERQGHDFKPNFDAHLLLGRDYITPIFAVRRSAFDTFRSTAERSAEVDLYSLVTTVAGVFGPSAFYHIPSILLHLNVPLIADLNEAAAAKSPVAVNYAGLLGFDASVTPHSVGLGLLDVSFNPPSDSPLVSIIIPTKNKVEMIAPCVATVLKMTTYPNFEVLIIDNGSDKQDVLDYFASLTDYRVRVIRHEAPFNWSEINNFAVTLATGELLCFLNDDTRVTNPAWLSEMVGAVGGHKVGAVGAKLVYPNGTLQHIGVISNSGICGHAHKGLPANLIGYQGIAILPHGNAAQTGACLLVSRANYDAAGGFNEQFSHNYNDVAFCLELRRLGLVNIYVPRAELQHFEGVSRVSGMSEEGQRLLREEGLLLSETYPEPDPYWNPNLVFTGSPGGSYVIGVNYDLLNWMPRSLPWLKERGEPRRVLLYGPTESALSEKRDGCAVFTLGVQGNDVRIVDPPMDNCRTFDLRRPEAMKESLEALGIDEVLVTSVSGTSLIALSFLSRLGLPVTYRPIDAEMACPRGDLMIPEEPCGDGWASGKCQSCLDRFGSVNGYVNKFSWAADWARFITQSNVSVDLSELQDNKFVAAIQSTFQPRLPLNSEAAE